MSLQAPHQDEVSRNYPLPLHRADRYLPGRSASRCFRGATLAGIEFSGSRGHTILELAFSWLLRRPDVASVIAGATSPEQARNNAAAAGWKLTDAELAEVDSIATGPV